MLNTYQILAYPIGKNAPYLVVTITSHNSRKAWEIAREMLDSKQNIDGVAVKRVDPKEQANDTSTH